MLLKCDVTFEFTANQKATHNKVIRQRWHTLACTCEKQTNRPKCITLTPSPRARVMNWAGLQKPDWDIWEEDAPETSYKLSCYSMCTPLIKQLPAQSTYTLIPLQRTRHFGISYSTHSCNLNYKIYNLVTWCSFLHGTDYIYTATSVRLLKVYRLICRNDASVVWHIIMSYDISPYHIIGHTIMQKQAETAQSQHILNCEKKWTIFGIKYAGLT